MIPKTFIVIVAWNDREFLPELLGSLCPAPQEDVQVLVIDNGSDDGPSAAVRAQFPHVVVLRNARNLGYAQALNQAFRYVFNAWQGASLDDRCVVLASPDVRVAPDYVSALRAALATYPSLGSAGGLLLRAFRDPQAEHPIADPIKSDVIESAGILARANRTFVSRGAGDIDRGQFPAGSLFGVAPGCVAYRASALDAIRVAERIADADLEAGSVAADIAWRLQAAGWESRYVPSARAFKLCGVQTAAAMTATSTRAVHGRPRDRWEMILKNEPFPTLLLQTPRFILSWMGEAWRSPERCFAPLAALLRLPAIWAKRRVGKAARKVRAFALNRWFV